jgi:HNH endonuclease
VPRRRSLPRKMQLQVHDRARARCEYCHTAEQWQYVPFTVDRIVPLAQGRPTILENLALACFHCNRRKSIQLTAQDPQSGAVVPLFNPRQHAWSEHFVWSVDGLLLLGLTPTGRATITALALNWERVIAIRAADIAVGRHPPAGDPLEPVPPSC